MPSGLLRLVLQRLLLLPEDLLLQYNAVYTGFEQREHRRRLPLEPAHRVEDISRRIGR